MIMQVMHQKDGNTITDIVLKFQWGTSGIFVEELHTDYKHNCNASRLITAVQY